MPEALATGEQLLLVSCRHALGRLDEGLQLREPEGHGACVPGELLLTSPRGDELAPCEPCLATALELLRTAERVEHVELK